MIRVLLLVLLLLAPASAGTVEGTVEIESALKKAPEGPKRRLTLPSGRDPYGDEKRAPAKRVDEVRHVVVYLEGKGLEKGGAQTAVMDQHEREFIPFVLPITAGTTVSFPNNDRIYHSVYSESSPKKFQLPEYPKGETRQVTFEEAGVVRLFCGIHPRMRAYILVLDNKYFVIPDKDHKYRLSGVPDGKYVLKAWHPLLEPVSRTIEVKGGKAVTVNFTL